MSTDLSGPTSLRLHGSLLWLTRIAWLALAALATVPFLVALPARYQAEVAELAPYRQLGLPLALLAIYHVALDAIVMLEYLAIAAVIFWRQSHDRITLFVSFALLALGASFPEDVPAWRLPANAMLALGYAALMILLLVFPDGRFVPRWTRFFAVVWVVWQVAWPFVPALDPHRVNLLVSGTWVSCFLVGIIAQIYRYVRVSSRLQRQQSRWIVFSLTVWLPIIAAVAALPVFFPALDQPGSLSALLYDLIGQSLIPFLLSLLIPLSIAIAILRYRLWDLDFVINRSLVYGALTALLAAVFAGSLYLVSLVTQGQYSLLAFGVAAAAAGSLFQPIRQRLQRFVDRRFYNIQIDYRKPRRPMSRGAVSALRQTHFGAYTGLDLIGRGGMAEVYKATHPTLDQPVAIKLLPAHLAAAPDFRKRFEREARVVSQLEHPNIVRVYDFGADPEADTHYMVMEFFAGDLGHYLRQAGRLTLDQARPLIRDIAAALDYAHAQGVIHRDIKPSNVMLDWGADDRRPTTDVSPSREAVLRPPSASRAVLTDFGIAKIRGSHTAMTRTGMLGTFDYIAPEQIQASADVDGRADIYAFGVMAYQMLAGELPFRHHNPGALLMAHLAQPPPDPRQRAPELSDDAAYAIRRAMAKSPGERYATAGEFVAALG